VEVGKDSALLDALDPDILQENDQTLAWIGHHHHRWMQAGSAQMQANGMLGIQVPFAAQGQ
jgi:hypothetical protein